jgi:hypothetical protein
MRIIAEIKGILDQPNFAVVEDRRMLGEELMGKN